MIALIASAALVLYVLLPDFIFNQIANQFVLLKKPQRTRIGEIAAGIAVVLLPFCAALLFSHLFWFVGHWPFPISESGISKHVDYRVVASGLYSEKFFDDQPSQFWVAVGHVCMHQTRFLFWDYVFLLIESVIVSWLTASYGSFRQVWLFERLVGKWLLRRASQWHVLLTPFLFPANNRPAVFVDVIVADGHLYRGRIGDFFLTANGDLASLLVKEVRRFKYSQYQADITKADPGQVIPKEDYWRDIPSANFIIPYEKIITLNISYEFGKEQQVTVAKSALKDAGIVGAEVVFEPDQVGQQTIDQQISTSPPEETQGPMES
jgi:hypothetical protein